MIIIQYLLVWLIDTGSTNREQQIFIGYFVCDIFLSLGWRFSFIIFVLL